MLLFFPQFLYNSQRKVTAAYMATLDSDPTYLTHLTSITNPCAYFILQPYGLSLFLKFTQPLPDLGALHLLLLFSPQSTLPPAPAMGGCFSLRKTPGLPYPIQPHPPQSLCHNILFYCIAKTYLNPLSLLGDYLSPLFRKQHKSRDSLLLTTYLNA